MALLSWRDEYSVGVGLLDEQHRILIESLNDLQDAMARGHAHSMVVPLLASLVAYTQDHFRSEEALLDRTFYPQREDHRAQHEALSRQLAEVARGFARGDAALSPQMVSTLRDWLMAHTLHEDKKCGAWLNEHGVR